MEQLLKVTELAKKLNVSRQTIYNLIKDGLPLIKINGSTRFDYEDVISWIKQKGEKYD